MVIPTIIFKCFEIDITVMKTIESLKVNNLKSRNELFITAG